MSLLDYRNEYTKYALSDDQLLHDPRQQFHAWLKHAMDENAPEPTAMTLSTVNSRGQPTSRIVLLKGYEEDGLHFYTNYLSRKGQELAANPHACLSFFWPTMQRQVRFEGIVRKLPRELSESYFHSRPLASRRSAIASPQSAVTTRDALEQRLSDIERSGDEHPPCPEYWGGYVLDPHYIEFWQGRACRLHDRFAFEHSADKRWHISRLAP